MSDKSTDAGRRVWEANAEFWDAYMGDESNRFHREVVRPRVSELLDIQASDYILDVACGNGNYSAYMAAGGAEVVAFDYSHKMIDLAKKRQEKFRDKISFHVIDATKEGELLSLKKQRPYTKAVSNMAVMDIAEIDVLFLSVNKLLAADGFFVFSTQHPCFKTLTDRYLSPHSYKNIAIEGQPAKQFYYHRSLQDIFHTCFRNGFIIDGFYEEAYGTKEEPDIIIVRARKPGEQG